MSKHGYAVRMPGPPHPSSPPVAGGRGSPGAAASRSRLGLSIGLLCAVPVSAQAAHPLSYMTGAGAKNYPVVALIWGLIAISLTVVVIVTALLLIGTFRRRPIPPAADPLLVPPFRPTGGMLWIYIGSAISGFVLFAAALWSFGVLAGITTPPPGPDFRIEIVGHQWWWEVQYHVPDAPSRDFITANEIHIPIRQPVRFVVRTSDVIHSFWVPALSGKTDTIPGQNNLTWLEADKPGVYRGQCTEYCGQQHAHMGFVVVAEDAQAFRAWWDRQLAPAATPSTPALARGEMQFVGNCGGCHTVRGTAAGGRIGPDLSHIASRAELAAGTLPNSIGYLSGWISDPQRIKPGNLMPTLTLSAPQLDGIRDYLETLR